MIVVVNPVLSRPVGRNLRVCVGVYVYVYVYMSVSVPVSLCVSLCASARAGHSLAAFLATSF